MPPSNKASPIGRAHNLPKALNIAATLSGICRPKNLNSAQTQVNRLLCD